jgi:hypothetical protein
MRHFRRSRALRRRDRNAGTFKKISSIVPNQVVPQRCEADETTTYAMSHELLRGRKPRGRNSVCINAPYQISDVQQLRRDQSAGEADRTNRVLNEVGSLADSLQSRCWSHGTAAPAPVRRPR